MADKVLKAKAHRKLKGKLTKRVIYGLTCPNQELLTDVTFRYFGETVPLVLPRDPPTPLGFFMVSSDISESTQRVYKNFLAEIPPCHSINGAFSVHSCQSSMFYKR